MIQGAFCPLGEPRFICDEMLQGLGQWLRVAGYDTRLPEEGWPDRRLLEEARRESRWLVTADTDLLGFREAPLYVVHLSEDDQEGRLKQLTQLMDLDWCYRPFSRCKTCNTPLETAGDDAVARLVSPHIELEGQTVLLCPNCEKLFWAGSHVRRMRETLRRLNQWRKPAP